MSAGRWMVAGIAGVAIWKVLGLLVLPFLGALVGFFGMVLKAIVVGAVVLFVLRMFRRRREGHATA